MKAEILPSFDIVLAARADGAPQGAEWLRLGRCAVRRGHHGRFAQDSFTRREGRRLICLEGVVLNSADLIRRGAARDLGEAVEREYERRSWRFPAELRGNFAGFVYNEAEDSFLAFTNHFGSRPLFRYEAEGGDLLLSTSLEGLSRLMRERGEAAFPDELGAMWLLTFGYMLDGRTLVRGVERLAPGTVLLSTGSKIETKAYWTYSNEVVETGEDEAVQGFYERFCQAIKRGFDKDGEYGYRHVALLSGGLDSRMVSYFAHRLGYKDLLTVTFGQSGCADEDTAAAISAELGFDHVFMPLGRGDYLLDAEEPVRRNGGLILYSGSAHAVRTYRTLDWRRLGLLHNGNLADASQGDYVDGREHSPPSPLVWAYSTRLYEGIREEAEAVARRYPNQEAFAIHTRGINGILNGSISALAETETDEPFLDADLVDFASHLPLRLKYREYLFVRMIETRFPDAARHPWQKWGLRPTVANYRLTGSFGFRAYRKGMSILRSRLRPGRPQKSDMNPLGFWWKSNPRLKAGLDRQYAEAMASTRLSGRILEECERLYACGAILEKTQALTLLTAARRLGLGSAPGAKK